GSLGLLGAAGPCQDCSEHARHNLLGIVRQALCSPSNETVRAYQHRSRSREPIRICKAQVRVAQRGCPYAIGLQLKSLEAAGGRAGCGTPGRTLEGREQHERTSEEIYGRDLFAATIQPDVRSARAWATECKARVVVHLVLAVLCNDGGRAVQVAQLDIEIVGRRLEVLGPEIGCRAGDIPRVGLLDCEPAD